MNNKGFAISGILYGVFLLFLMLLLSLLHVLVVKINRLTTLAEEVNSNVENVGCVGDVADSCASELVYDTSLGDGESIFTTKVRGKYTIKVNDSTNCSLYLPKNITLVIDNKQIKYIKPDDGSGVINVNEGTKNVIDGNTCGTNIDKFEVIKVNSSIYND